MNRVVTIAAAIAGVAIGGLLSYKIATDEDLRKRLLRSAKDAFETSKKKVNTMSEDVAIRTAQLTKNPKVNQEWVSNQWDTLGL